MMVAGNSSLSTKMAIFHFWAIFWPILDVQIFRTLFDGEEGGRVDIDMDDGWGWRMAGEKRSFLSEKLGFFTKFRIFPHFFSVVSHFFPFFRSCHGEILVHPGCALQMDDAALAPRLPGGRGGWGRGGEEGRGRTGCQTRRARTP